jgi:hypothetical protein
MVRESMATPDVDIRVARSRIIGLVFNKMALWIKSLREPRVKGRNLIATEMLGYLHASPCQRSISTKQTDPQGCVAAMTLCDVILTSRESHISGCQLSVTSPG